MTYTFLLPAFKARFFEEALGSILAQTYRDFEVIVSDDCSPEDLKSIVDKFADSRVKYRRNERNIGAERLVDHWNLLLDLTDAEYIIMASDDDVYDPRYLEEMDKLARKYPEASVVRGRLRRIDSDGNEIKKEDELVFDWLRPEDALWKFAKYELFSGIPQYIFKTMTLKSLGGFAWCPGAWYSDDLTVYKMMFEGKSGMAFTKDIVFSSRVSDINISAASNDRRNIAMKLDATASYEKAILELLRDNGLDAELELYFKDRARSLVCDNIEHHGYKTFLWGLRQCANLESMWLSFPWRTYVLLRHTCRHFTR